MMKKITKKRITAGIAALLLCAAMAVPAGAQTISVPDSLAAVESENTVQAQAVKVDTDFVGMTELLSYSSYSDGTSASVIARADLTGNGKLKCVLDLENSATKDKWGNQSYITSVNKKYITAYYTVQTYETGYIYWNYKYVYKNGKFKLVSNKAKTYSSYGAWESTGSYQSLFAKNQFVTKKKLKLYKAPGSKMRSATIAANKTVTLQKICCKNGKIFVKFTYGSKSGWTKIGWSNSKKNYDTWFYGIAYAG